MKSVVYRKEELITRQRGDYKSIRDTVIVHTWIVLGIPMFSREAIECIYDFDRCVKLWPYEFPEIVGQ